MTVGQQHQAAFSEIRSVVSWARDQLTTFQPPREMLGDYIPPTTFLGIPRRARLVRVGEVWRLGIFLLTEQGDLFRAGESTRVVEVARIEHASPYRTERATLMDAAYRGGFPVGSVVNFDAYRILLDTEALSDPRAPLFARGDHAFVRWREGATDDECVPFVRYMTERLELVLNPPQGATD
jgi:hypothetical protein